MTKGLATHREVGAWAGIEGAHCDRLLLLPQLLRLLLLTLLCLLDRQPVICGGRRGSAPPGAPWLGLGFNASSLPVSGSLLGQRTAGECWHA